MATDGAGTLSADAGADDASTAPIVHAFKPNVFGSEHRYVLDRDTLTHFDGAQEERLALADIVRVRVYALPSGTGGILKRTVLRLRSGAKHVLQANSFERFGVTEDRAESYRRIVGELLRRTAQANPKVQVLTGPSTPLWALWLLALIGSVVILAAAGALAIKGELPLSGIVYLCPIVLLLPLCWRGVSVGRAQRTDPAQLSDDLFATE